jgi:hypothetical protein
LDGCKSGAGGMLNGVEDDPARDGSLPSSD